MGVNVVPLGARKGANESGRQSGNSLTTAGQTETVGRRRREADGSAHPLAHNCLGFDSSRRKLGAVADDLHARVNRLITGLGQKAHRLTHEDLAAGVGKFWSGGAEHSADVAQPRCCQQSITQGVRHGIAIAVP